MTGPTGTPGKNGEYESLLIEANPPLVDGCGVTSDRLRMALAEAGYPAAEVYGADDGDGPWFCDDVPADVWDRACEVVNR